MIDPLRLSRREILRFGTVSLGGLWLPDLVTAGLYRPRRAHACILLYMDGGPSHVDLWDLKPDAPEGIRGPFRSICTTVPGVRVCEHLPLTGRQMHRLVQVRSVRHEEIVHDPAVYQMLTGRKHVSSVGNLTVQPTDFPQFGTAFGKVDPAPQVMPKVVELPETMKMGGRILPGQNAGFLGAMHDPFRVEVTRNGRVIPPEFSLRAEVSSKRLAYRTSLVERLNNKVSMLNTAADAKNFDRFHQQALSLLAKSEIRRSFELEREPAPIRDKYGRNRHGQSVILARRLVEAGARFVTVYWGKEPQDWADGQGPRIANNPWDTHRNQFPLLERELLPRADRALAALISDLNDRGLLDNTLVVWMGDFGRSPRIDRKHASRDHWPHANTVLLAGAGLPAGTVYGRTDKIAAEVTDNPVSPADLSATILQLLGVNPQSLIQDGQGRPYPLSEGHAIDAFI